MNIFLEPPTIDPSIERLKRRRAKSQQHHEMFRAAAVTAGITWLTAGTLLFGSQWLRNVAGYLISGFMSGAFIGVLVVCYTIWVEVKAKIHGERAVWDTDAAHARPQGGSSYVQTKFAFSLLTIIALGSCGALAASTITTRDDLRTDLPRSIILIGVTIIVASVAAARARGLNQRFVSSDRSSGGNGKSG